MNHDYEDIRSRIAEPPKWFDEEAVPRYCDFATNELANIYALEAALVLITCQGCETPFKVAFSKSSLDDVIGHMRGAPVKTLADLIQAKQLHYGDPPNIGCCAAGPMMNSEPRRVLEYWHRVDFDWVRDGSLEINIEPDWVEDSAA